MEAQLGLDCPGQPRDPELLHVPAGEVVAYARPRHLAGDPIDVHLMVNVVFLRLLERIHFLVQGPLPLLGPRRFPRDRRERFVPIGLLLPLLHPDENVRMESLSSIHIYNGAALETRAV